MKKLLLIPSILSLFFVIGCSKAPTAEIDQAKSAMADAKSAEAAVYAPDLMKALEDKTAALDAELSKQNGKFFKNYKLTAQLAAELNQMAENAKQAAIEGKEKARSEAEAAIQEAETEINAATEALKTAPKAKGSTADLAALKSDIEAASLALQEAKADMLAQKYSDAKVKISGAREKAGKVQAEIQAAHEMQKSTRRK